MNADKQPLTEEQIKGILKLNNNTMLELMLLDVDNVNSAQLNQWIREELASRKK